MLRYGSLIPTGATAALGGRKDILRFVVILVVLFEKVLATTRCLLLLLFLCIMADQKGFFWCGLNGLDCDWITRMLVSRKGERKTSCLHESQTKSQNPIVSQSQSSSERQSVTPSRDTQRNSKISCNVTIFGKIGRLDPTPHHFFKTYQIGDFHL